MRATALANRDERAVHGRIVFHATVHEWSFVVEHLPNGRVPKGELTADRGLYTVCLHLSTRVLWTNDNRRMTREAAIAACDAFVAGMVLRGEARVYP